MYPPESHPVFFSDTTVSRTSIIPCWAITSILQTGPSPRLLNHYFIFNKRFQSRFHCRASSAPLPTGYPKKSPLTSHQLRRDLRKSSMAEDRIEKHLAGSTHSVCFCSTHLARALSCAQHLLWIQTDCILLHVWTLWRRSYTLISSTSLPRSYGMTRHQIQWRRYIREFPFI